MLEHNDKCEDGSNAFDETKRNIYLDKDDNPNTHSIMDDFTGDKRVDQLLKQKLVFERTISKISSRFVGTMNVDVAINASLCDMGQLSGASRSYIILIDDENYITINTHEWCAEGVEPQIDILKAIPLDETPWWIEKVRRGEIIHFPNVSKMPVEASLEKELLKSQDIKSILAFPLIIGDKNSGFIGFDNIRRKGEWKEGDFALLRITSEIIGNALKRQQIELKLKESKKNYKNLNKELEQKVKDRTDELKKSEERFQNMLFNLDAGYYNVKMDGVILYHNLSFNKILGHDPSENLIGKRPFNFWQNSEKQKNYIKVLMKNEAISDYITHIKKKNGEEIVVQVNAHLVKDDKGIPISIEGTFFDITDKFRMSQKLKESEKKYKLLYKGISVPTYTWQKVNNDLTLIDFNKASEEITNGKIRHILGIKASELHKDQLELLEELHRCANEKGNINREIKYRYNTDNKEKYLSVNYDFIPPDLVLVQTLNITKRKRAERKLKERTRKLEILNQIIIEGNRAKNISQLSENILRSTLELVGFEGGGIYLLEKEKRSAKIVCHDGLPLDFIEDADLIKIDQSPYNKIFIKGQPIFTENYHLLNPKRSKKWGFLSLASVPIFNKDKIIGALNIASKSRYIFSNEEKETLESIGREIGTVIVKMQAEEALRGSKANLQTLFDSLDDFMFVLNSEGHILNVNPSILKHLKYSEKEMLNMNILDIHPPNQREDAMVVIKEIIENKTDSIHIPLMTKDGKIIPVETKVTRGRWGDQEVFFGICRDITERLQAEQALQKKERFLSNIITSIQDGICIIDKNLNIIQTNPKIERWYSDKIPLVGKKCYQAFQQRSKPCKDCPSQKTIDTGKIAFSSARKKIVGGENMGTLEVYTFPLLDQETAKVYGVILYIRDITEQIKIENNLKESEEKYRSLYEKSPNALIIYNKKGILLDCNLATENIFGFRKEELIGKKYLDLVILNTDQELLKGKKHENVVKRGDLSQGECMIRRKNGSIAWLYYQSSIIKLNNEIFIEVIGQDITEKKKAEKIIKEEIKKLKELDKIKQDFITRMSHELKTPLVSIYSSTELLLDHYAEHFDDKARVLIEMINRGGRRLTNFIEDLLDVSRLDSDKFKSKKQKENIIEIIKECVNDTYYLAKKRKLFININIREDLYLDVDKNRFEQVITNLLSNAIKNTPPKGDISIALQKEKDFIDIEIKDSGVGFTDEEKEKIFKKFGKIERYGKRMDIDTEGSGLGLYISKEIVKLHGGRIWVESEGRNKGSTFIIRLPII